MIKYLETLVTFAEIPDEITLCINITNCPCNCNGCHSSYLSKDIGEELNNDVLDKLISDNSGISCIAFMGGDSSPKEINDLAKYVKDKHSISIAWYSGRQELSKDINLDNFDYIKLGPYIKELGPLTSKTTNQRLYQYGKFFSDYTIDKCWRDITYKFWND